MKTYVPFAAKDYWLLPLLLVMTIKCPAQNILEEANSLLKKGTDAVSQATDLVNTTRKNTAEFNSSVKVVSDMAGAGSFSSDQLNKPKFKKGKFTNFEWQPVAQFDGQLYPSMIISMANYTGDIGDPTMSALKSSALGFYFRSEKAFIPIRWEIECTDKTYFDKANGDFVMQNAAQDYCLMPAIPWNMATLAKQANTKPLMLIYRLYDAAGNKEERNETVYMRSINDCVYRYQQKSLDFLFAAFIQEQHPEIKTILQDAAKTKVTLSMNGYQADELQTLAKVCAVWKVLHDKGLTFSDAPAANVTGNITSQPVHTFGNAIAAGQGNAFDGAVVFASVLKAMGISTIIAVRQGHCLPGFYAGKKLVYLETTMLSNSDKIDAAKTQKQKIDAYVAQFLEAVKAGAKQYADYKAADDALEIDVNQARKVVKALPVE